jgi:DNA ligase D
VTAAGKKAPEVELTVGDHTVRISNPDRVYFSARGETKLDLARYYLSVGDGIVRALRERPCMMHRFPEGTDGEKVHQKRLPRGAPPWVETVRVDFPSGRHAYELCVTDLASVIWAVQMSTVEFHPWNSRRADTERPDEWRIDLDPMPECGFGTVRRVAHVAHAVLDEIGAVGWPKTSGGHGMHIYVRIEPRWGFADVRRAALAFAREVERRAPGDVTTTWWRKDREPDRLFVDYNQNARDHTIASAYSVRGVPEATVSTPIRWDEVDDVVPRDCTIATVPERFATLGDLHEGIDGAVFSLEPLLDWADRDDRRARPIPADRREASRPEPARSGGRGPPRPAPPAPPATTAGEPAAGPRTSKSQRR